MSCVKKFFVLCCGIIFFYGPVQIAGIKTAGCPYAARINPGQPPIKTKTCMMSLASHPPTFISLAIENGTFTPDMLTERSECDANSKYRSFDGYCNNLDHPKLGSSYSIQKRILPPEFEGNGYSPRTMTRRGTPLPNPRVVSLKVHQTINMSDSKRTHLLMIWGQYTDHDITLTPVSETDCAGCTKNPKCFPIPIPNDDPVFQSGTCMSFTRSMNGNMDHRTPRQSFNQITSYIDSSNVYGSNGLVASKLRSFKNGKLKLQENDLLPINDDQTFCQANKTEGCFLAGDIRNSENMGLASIQTLFAREHNKICDGLHQLNPHWNDCRLYLEARRIVDAEHQRVTYNEWLPTVLGKELVLQLGIVEPLSGSAYTTDYNSSCDAGITNEFSTAAFRFGHSLIQNDMQINRDGRNFPYKLEYNFNQPRILYENSSNVQGILLGATKQRVLANDRFVDEVIRDKLFETPNGEGAFDLAALNINRGRDHGIQGYNRYRQHFGLKNISTFQEFFENRIFAHSTMKALEETYDDVDDIDLFTGIVSELYNTITDDFILGDVGSRIIGDQFSRLKHCDRFFYSNSPNTSAGAFTKDQLSAIRKVKFSNILCNHMSGSSEVQENAFFREDNDNHLKKCSNLYPIDLTPWREEESATSTVASTTTNLRQATTTRRLVPTTR